jgi:hypothetical protein
MNRTCTFVLALLPACSLLPDANRPAAGPSETTEPVVADDTPTRDDDAVAEEAPPPPPPAEPHRAWCDAAIGTKPYWQNEFLEDTRDTLATRRQWIAEAPREQFVTATRDLMTKDFGWVVDENKLEVPAGAPLLLLECHEERIDYSSDAQKLTSVTFMTLDLVKLGAKVEDLDLAPEEFVFPPRTQWTFDAETAYAMSLPEERDQVEGSQELLDKRYRCTDDEIAACQAAEAKVMARKWTPDQEEKKKDACHAARKKAFDKCFSKKDRKAFERAAKALWILVEARDDAAYDALVAKLK